jgi:hypothetical protein
MKFRWFIVALAAVLISFESPAAPGEPVPILRAHAHNDYVHPHPLFDALDRGYCSVEADIHLIGDQLFVAHEITEVVPGFTLQSLYLDPLRKRIKENGGHVYTNGPEFILLIEVKTDGKTTYAKLRDVLQQYSDILTVFRDGKKETNAVTAILTGGYSRADLQADSVRYAAGDGTFADFDRNPLPSLVPWISEDWAGHFKWRGVGPIPDDERAQLKKFVTRAHEQGRKIRFWGAPDVPPFWKELLADDVDLINTDDLEGFRIFYNHH